MSETHAVFQRSNTAVITGGASGIGLALAAKCHASGMQVIIADRNSDLLSRAKATFSDGIVTMELDVSDVSDWARLKEVVTDQFGGRVNLLALNAGIGPTSRWDDLKSFHKILDTNLYGVINGINAMLPLVQSTATSGPSAIIITGSKQGITNPPGNPAYNASKAAVKVIAEHLSYDLKGDTTSVHLLVPGWTFTGLSGGGPGSTKEKPAGAWTPDEVVDFLVKKMAAGTFYIICPDNEVAEETDRKRMLWGAGDAIYDRPPLSRWRDEWKGKAQDWMDKQII